MIVRCLSSFDIGDRSGEWHSEESASNVIVLVSSNEV